MLKTKQLYYEAAGLIRDCNIRFALILTKQLLLIWFQMTITFKHIKRIGKQPLPKGWEVTASIFIVSGSLGFNLLEYTDKRALSRAATNTAVRVIYETADCDGQSGNDSARLLEALEDMKLRLLSTEHSSAGVGAVSSPS